MVRYWPIPGLLNMDRGSKMYIYFILSHKFVVLEQ